MAERCSTLAGALQSDTTSEDVKGAAALALGGVAVGNLGAYLPSLLTAVRGAVSLVNMHLSCGSFCSLTRCIRPIATDQQTLATASGSRCGKSSVHALRPSELPGNPACMRT